MMTTNRRNALNDCLFYVVQEVGQEEAAQEEVAREDGLQGD